MAEHSDDPGSKDKGGKFDRWLRLGEPHVSPPYVGAVFEIEKIGDYSEVISTQFGFHIVRLDGIQEEYYKDFEEVEQTIIDTLVLEYEKLAMKEFNASYNMSDEVQLNDAALDEILEDRFELEAPLGSRDLADLHARGVDVAEPSDPLHDRDFVRALVATYTIAPTTDWLIDGEGIPRCVGSGLMRIERGSLYSGAVIGRGALAEEVRSNCEEVGGRVARLLAAVPALERSGHAVAHPTGRRHRRTKPTRTPRPSGPANSAPDGSQSATMSSISSGSASVVKSRSAPGRSSSASMPRSACSMRRSLAPRPSMPDSRG